MGSYSIKEKYFKFLLYIVVIVLLNIAGVTLFFRADLTKDKLYSLSEASQEVVETLSEPLSIKVFFSKDLPAPHNNTARYLKDLLDEYAAIGGRYFNYTFYNVTPEEGTLTKKSDENRTMARDYGIHPVQIQIMENDEVKFKNAYMGLVIIHGDLVEKIPAITSTSGLEYQLTTAIQKMNNKVSALLRLDDKIKVNMYLSSSLNKVGPLIGLDQLDLLGDAIEKTISGLNNKTLGVIQFTSKDIADRKELEALGEKYDLMVLSWPAVPQKNIRAGQGAASIVVEYKDKHTTMPLINSVELPIIGTTYQMADPDSLEEQINAVIEQMIGINSDLGFLSSHGAHSLMPDQMAMMQGRPGGGMQVLNSLISKRYAVKPVDLKTGSIPDGLNCLVIPRPTEPFSEYELFQIDQALMKGTNLVFFCDPYNESAGNPAMGMPPGHFPINTGLENLLEHYGIKWKQAYVLDKQCYVHRDPRSRGPKEQPLYFIPHLKESTINHDPAFMNNIKELLLMQVGPVELVEENIDKDKVKAIRLLRSSDQAWLMEGRVNLNPMTIMPPAGEEMTNSYDLAYLLEGEFTSYFKGRPVPKKESGQEKAGEAGKETAPEKDAQKLEGLKAENLRLDVSKPAKIFVLPSSQILQDNLLDPQGMTTNTTFILNVIDHMNGKDKIAALRSKQQQYNPIEETTPFVRGIIKAGNIVVLPVLVVLFGMGVLVKRAARKKKIANRFKN